ncbi:unnamed protein product [Ilex paraguariensis]|uniref:RING-type E3 ubiquitin transferase n=1 Tax=Ilex paraguariensis TaxID=185542 RepID=A0ABC8RA75_9AQUA
MGDITVNGGPHDPLENPPKSYALSGKIMLSAIIILFVVVVVMVVLHLYARWYLLRAQRRQVLLRRRRSRSRARRRAHLVFYVDNPNSTATRGLEPSVLNLLPEFIYSPKTHPETLECAVCLSEFEENEKGRLLPKCNHSFHVDCIDMWFHAHSTCPICRSLIEPVQAAENNRSDVVVSVGETEPGSSSVLCLACPHEEEEEQSASTSMESRRKVKDMVGVTIEVPRRNQSGDELGLSSPASQGFKSPGARLFSLKRIISMNRRGSDTGSSSGGSSVGTELDIERGVAS